MQGKCIFQVSSTMTLYIDMSTYLVCGARLDEVFLQYIIQGWIQNLLYVLYQQGSAQGKCILQMSSEIFMV